ncbi:MAG TPA: glutaredoxin family protein [Methylophilaceae bacterium]|nr:glutaredoxin family protein [Methylophilaceae bacterium]
MRLFVAFLLAGWAALANAQLYKWTDSEGRVHYSDLPQLPSTPGVEKAKLPPNVIQSDPMPYALQETVRKNPISLYSFDKCGEPCKLAQSLLDKRGVPYQLKNGQTTHRAELQKLTGDTKMPILVVGNKLLKSGYVESTWNRVLDEAGYPRSNPLAKFHKKSAPNIAPVAVEDTPGVEKPVP